jgi:hypothetical protein
MINDEHWPVYYLGGYYSKCKNETFVYIMSVVTTRLDDTKINNGIKETMTNYGIQHVFNPESVIKSIGLYLNYTCITVHIMHV